LIGVGRDIIVFKDIRIDHCYLVWNFLFPRRSSKVKEFDSIYSKAGTSPATHQRVTWLSNKASEFDTRFVPEFIGAVRVVTSIIMIWDGFARKNKQ
jgi:hypothetical protein